MSGEEAVAWVNKYRKFVMEKIRGYSGRSPYDEEDHIQDAYEAALIATRVCKAKKITFSSVFWMTFRRVIHAKTHGKGSLQTTDFQEYDDAVFYGGDRYFSDPEEEVLSSGVDNDPDTESLLELMEHLTLTERRVLVCVAGLTGGRMSYAETASFLGTSEGAVSQTFRRILRKAILLRSQGLPPLPSHEKHTSARHRWDSERVYSIRVIDQRYHVNGGDKWSSKKLASR